MKKSKTDYKSHVNLIRKIAWSFHRSTGLDWDDLFQEGYIAYHNGVKQYDGHQKITTFLWWVISNHLKSYVYLEQKKGFNGKTVEYPYNLLQEESCLFESLSKDGQEVAGIIFKMGPDLPNNTKKAQQMIGKKLRDKGYRWKDIWLNCKEIEDAFKD